jgi:hypothetical protein
VSKTGKEINGSKLLEQSKKALPKVESEYSIGKYLDEAKAETKSKVENAIELLNNKRMRKWLISHGKMHLLDFHDR